MSNFCFKLPPAADSSVSEVTALTGGVPPEDPPTKKINFNCPKTQHLLRFQKFDRRLLLTALPTNFQRAVNLGAYHSKILRWGSWRLRWSKSEKGGCRSCRRIRPRFVQPSRLPFGGRLRVWKNVFQFSVENSKVYAFTTLLYGMF